MPITKADVERYTLAKISVLSCGYGVAGAKFRTAAMSQSGGSIHLSLPEAERSVRTYRDHFSRVPKLWTKYGKWLPTLASLSTEAVYINGQHVLQLMPYAIRGPSGLIMHYDSLQLGDEQHSSNWWYLNRHNMRIKLYGAKLVENVTQHLARVIVCQAQSRIRERTGFRPCGQSHDELIYCVPEPYIDRLAPVLKEEMSRPPVWAYDIPLSGEVKAGPTYGDLIVIPV